MNRIILAAVVVLSLSPVSLAAQGVDDATGRIEQALERARAAGIPVSLLENKVAEGRAKGVPLDRIAVAVERRGEALQRASAVMGGPDLPDADLAVGADALLAGVSEAVLRAISEAERSGRRTVAIAALTQLVEMGHVPEEALARVQEALQRGPDALTNLPAQAGRGHGGPPGAVGRPEGVGGPPSIPAPGRKPGTGRPPGKGKPAGVGGASAAP